MNHFLKACAVLASFLITVPYLAQAQQSEAAKREDEFSARARATANGSRRMAPIPPEQWTAEQKAANESHHL